MDLKVGAIVRIKSVQGMNSPEKMIVIEQKEEKVKVFWFDKYNSYNEAELPKELLEKNGQINVT